MSEAVRIAIQASAAQTATGNSGSFNLSTASQLFVGVDITAQSGTTPTLTVWLMGSYDGGTTWFDMPNDLALITATTAATGTMSATSRRNIVDTINIATAGAQKHVAIYRNVACDKIRANWVISGAGATLTFSISAVAK